MHGKYIINGGVFTILGTLPKSSPVSQSEIINKSPTDSHYKAQNIF
jgi:hypothetical protein